VRENWDELRHPVVPPGGSLGLSEMMRSSFRFSLERICRPATEIVETTYGSRLFYGLGDR
jgi:hypothetical protein